MARQAPAPAPAAQELVIPLLALGFTLYYFWTVQELTAEAKANGIVIGGILVVLVALLLVRLAMRLKRGEVSLRFSLGGDWPTDRLRLLLFAQVLAMVLVMPLVGTIPAMAGMLLAGMWLLGGRHWPTLIGVSLITPLLVWATLMVGIGTRFPVGPVERLLFRAIGMPLDD
jgi:hypothetical protein